MHLLEVVLSLLILHIYSVRLIKRQDTSLLPKHYGLSIRSQIGECLKSCFIIATSVSTVHAETNPKSIEILKSTIFEVMEISH